MIPEIKKILYATDLTKNSAYASHYAADLARRYGAKVVILHCVGLIDPSVYYEGSITDPSRSLRRAAEQEKEEHTAELKTRLQEFFQGEESRTGPPGADLVSEIIVTSGYEVEKILDTADAKGCDLIILGTHGKGWLKQTFLGSVSRLVLERTQKPVFIVPLPSEETSINWGLH